MADTVWLHVAEKPSVAREVSRAMTQIRGGAGEGSLRTSPGASRYNPVHELPLAGRRMLVTSVTGHLMEDEFPPHARGWATFPIEELFSVAVNKVVPEKNKPIERNLQDLARRAGRVVLWLDCDREGEGICFEVLSVVRAANPRIQVSRARFSALTVRDVERAMGGLVEPDRRASDAVDARQEIDLRIGAAFTRLQTLTWRDRLLGHGPAAAAAAGGASNVLSFGPCQFPCLGFIVERHMQREGFVAETFWHVEARHATTAFAWARGHVFDAGVVALLAQDIHAAAERDDATGRLVARVVAVDKRPTRRRAPAPLATVELQKLVSQHLRIGADRCMHLAEALYQEGVLSYPRTETDSYTFTDAELQELVRPHAASAVWGAHANALLPAPGGNLYRRPSSGGHNDNAHPPIHPTKFVDLTGGGGRDGPDKARLYELVCRHFFACMHPDAEAAETSVTATVGAELFHASGFAIVSRGWLDVFTYERWTSSRAVPNYSVGEAAPLDALEVKEGRTEPPPLLTEAQLIGRMDAFGIGTDATIATHLKTIQDRGYAELHAASNTFRPTPLGLALARAYDAVGLAELWQPQLRAQTERAMGDIALGRAARADVVRAFTQVYLQRFRRVREGLMQMTAVLRDHFPERFGHAGGHGGGGGGDGGGGGGGVAIDVVPAAVNAAAGGGFVAAPPPPAAAFTRVVRAAPFSVCGACGDSTVLTATLPGVGGPNGRLAVRCNRCDSTLPLPASATTAEPAPANARCLLCGFGVVMVASAGGPQAGNNGAAATGHGADRPYPVCPSCTNRVPRDVEDAAPPGGGLRCGQCVVMRCPFAGGGGLAVIPQCPICRTHPMRLQRSGRGGVFLGCRGFPQCRATVTLPASSGGVDVCASGPNATCTRCNSRLLKFYFAPHECPPNVDPGTPICVQCDSKLHGYVSVNPGTGGGGGGGGGGADGARLASGGGLGGGGAPPLPPAPAPAPAVATGAYELPALQSARMTVQQAAGARRQLEREVAGGANGTGGDGAPVVCQCGVAARRCVSKKEGSAGRAFVTCAERKCKFFAWLDAPPG